MTHDDHTPQATVLDLVHSMRDIEQRAAQPYRPLVNDLLQTGGRDARYIELTLVGLPDLCGRP